MKKELLFVVIPDIQLGRESIIINPWDKLYYLFKGIPTKKAVVGKAIAERLRKAIKWINAHPEIDFVVSIGDITDSATPEQFQKASQICSQIQKPFIVLIGNHDVWPYQRRKKKIIWEAEKPISVEEFESHFKAWEDYPLFENVQRQKGWLQNFAFTIRDTKFVVVDNNNRRKAPFGLPGQAGWAKLYQESYRWLKEQVLNSSEEKIVIFSHAPLKRNLLEKFQKLAKKETINIAGHRHKRTESRKRNVITITTNALYHEPLILIARISETVKAEYQRI